MFLTTLYGDKIINTDKIQEVRLTDEEYPSGWYPESYSCGAYFIVIDILNEKGETESVFYKSFPILDEEFADGYEYPKFLLGTKQEYLETKALEKARCAMRKLCKKINKKVA